MAYVISDGCVSCGACEGQCPCWRYQHGRYTVQIDPDKCISCGSCAGACPTGSISEE